MNGRCQGKTALVTGSGSGLGRASAEAFAAEGAKVVVADIDEKSGRQTVEMIKKAGGEAAFVKTDVLKAADVERMVNYAVATYGRLDCAHNNVGAEELSTSLVECTEEQFEKVLSINLKSAWLCTKYEIIQMLKQGGGAIVNTASHAGLHGAPNISSYVAAKHGVVGLSRAAAVEYAKKGIRVNVVCPAGMKGTAMYNRIAKLNPESP